MEIVKITFDQIKVNTINKIYILGIPIKKKERKIKSVFEMEVRYFYRSFGLKKSKRLLWLSLCHKLDNKDEMKKLLGKHNLPKLAEEAIESFNILNTKKLNYQKSSHTHTHKTNIISLMNSIKIISNE